MAPIASLSATLALLLSLGAWWYVNRVSVIDPLPCRCFPAPQRQGVFAKNRAFHHLEKLGAGKLPAPEDITTDSRGSLYAGCADGWIKRVEPDTGKVENWTYVGGHPLGLKWGLNGELLVCEPSRGLLNVTADKVEVLSDVADGVKYKLADGVDVAKDGTIYFTDASHEFGLSEWQYDFVQCRPNGRLLKYDPWTRTTTVLLRDLFFPNGVALSAEQDFLVFCETTMLRCMKYHLRGEREGRTETFIDNLPGYPDNIKHDSRDTFWLALLADRNRLTDLAMKTTCLKHMLTLSPRLLEAVFRFDRRAKALAVSEAGEALTLYEDPTGESVSFLTTALPVGEHLYLGNLRRNYIGKLKLRP